MLLSHKILCDYLNILDLILPLADIGLVVLIWIVQLIVYPSFLYYSKENLVRWHQKYTQKIAIIVVPLMLTQLAIVSLKLFYNISLYNIVSFLTVIFLWGFTFLYFAPAHFKISEGKANSYDLLILIKRNWIRTILWSLLFLYHFST